MTITKIIQGIGQRMYDRRQRERRTTKARYTLCYAVSVKTSNCYVGYNMPGLNKTNSGSKTCAENRAEYVANTYGESKADLVFFAMNINGEFFNPCEGCQTWILQSRGYLKNQSRQWTISTTSFINARYVDKPFVEKELKNLIVATNEVSDESKQYYQKINFLQ